MKIIKKIQQCIKHIKTMFYTKMLAVSLRKILQCDIVLNKIKYFWVERKLKRNRIKTHKDMINQQAKLPLRYQVKNVENAKLFLRKLGEYIQTNEDTIEFNEKCEVSYNIKEKSYSLVCVWKTHNFNLEFTDVINNGGLWLEFTFRIEKTYNKDIGIHDGELRYERVTILNPTGLKFYINYIGESFNVRSNNGQSHNTSDYGYITNIIANELVSDLNKKPNR